MLNRFVLDKSHPRMRHDVWFFPFSGSLHSARSFCRVSMTVEDVFVLQHAFKRVEQPDGSHEGVGRKQKKESCEI